MFLTLYRGLTSCAAVPLTALLKRRLRKGKEDPLRWREKTGTASAPRPQGPLIWLHAASVGEAQSALILIEKILWHDPDLHVLITSGTVTSARLLSERLPSRALHQFAPLDHPAWVRTFLEHWQPDLALWLESELWPNMLGALSSRKIPVLLLNARLSEASFHSWQRLGGMPRQILQAFSLILCQTETDAVFYRQLGAERVEVSGNIKYSAAPLPYDPQKLAALQKSVGARPLWVYASTHAPEEELAARLHQRLKAEIPDLLTVIVPRHPERGDTLAAQLQNHPDLSLCRRTGQHHLPPEGTDLYLCDTMGELGLFYRLAPLAAIGRSFSADGGGGHNPIEAAQLGCAVLHGPHVQNLQEIYDDMAAAGACLPLRDEEEFYQTLRTLLTSPQYLAAAQRRAEAFVAGQQDILNGIWTALLPYLSVLHHKQARHA
ncbi:MAG: 3-deoxy-D-manno-octulosonic acid transferase [Rhodospirillales bacterium]|nr:3-deoxy-D-manno-octulosonic acid transferase [Rhodospirillales bacterium]MCB9964822.1 3-deoxy-D-manno-octulosonic acid transferase [Rhodospirillales bacterium]